MTNRSLVTRIGVLALLIAGMSSAHAATPAQKSTSSANAPQVSLRAVDYAQLERNVGQRIVVHTTIGTTRQGVLKRFSKVNITVQLGADNGAIELEIPRNTIREALLEIAPADPLFLNEKSPYEGKSGAQKN
jgi:hypothetical protein